MIRNHRDALTWPDGFLGGIHAFEGIEDAATILNAPTGCKLFPARTIELQYPREFDFEEMRYAEEFFFGQARLPCTYLDDYDYVFGSSQKLEYVFGRVADKGYRLVGVLNSPGAALIGDDLDRYLQWSGITIPAVVIDKPDFSLPYDVGWANAVQRTLEVIAPAPMPVDEHCVNLVGLSIWNKSWDGSIIDLEELLRRCGINVHTVLCAGATVEQLRSLRRARCNVVLHDELGSRLGAWMQQQYGMPWVRSPEGAPFGFDATEHWLKLVCEAVGVDSAPGVELINRRRDQACRKLMEFSLETGLPRGASFGVCLDASLALPAVKWMHAYLGMVPAVVQVPDESQPLAEALREYLAANGMQDAWNAELDGANPPQAVISNDAIVRRVMVDGKLAAGVAVAMPDTETTEFVQRSVLGTVGPLWVLERLAAGLWTLVE